MEQRSRGPACPVEYRHPSDALGRQAVRSMLNHFLLGLPGIPRAVLCLGEQEGKSSPPAFHGRALGRQWDGGLAAGLDSKGYTGNPV